MCNWNKHDNKPDIVMTMMMRESTGECVSLCDGNAIRGSMGSSTISVTHIHHRCHHRHCCHHHYHHITSTRVARASKKRIETFFKTKVCLKAFSNLGQQALEGRIKPWKFCKFLAIHKIFLAIQWRDRSCQRAEWKHFQFQLFTRTHQGKVVQMNSST